VFVGGVFVIKWLLIGFVVVAISQILVRFAKGIRATVSDTKAGKAVHVATALGGFDLKPQEKLDPLFASMLVYPGATPAESQPPEYEADLQLLGREFRILVATYWTLTPADAVWEFYKRELPDWHEKRQRGYGRSLAQETVDGTRTIRIYKSQDGSTLIETRISIKHKTEAAAAGNSSNTRFGILR
jgi:hypothetical protein